MLQATSVDCCCIIAQRLHLLTYEVGAEAHNGEHSAAISNARGVNHFAPVFCLVVEQCMQWAQGVSRGSASECSNLVDAQRTTENFGQRDSIYA